MTSRLEQAMALAGLSCALSVVGCGDDAKAVDPGATTGGGDGSPTGGASPGGGGVSPGGAAGATNSGGGGTPTGSAGGAMDTTERTYEADDKNIVYSGRIDFTDPKKPKFSAAATTISAKWTGTACTIKLLDENRYGMNRNYYDVSIDNGKAIKLAAIASQTDYEVGAGQAYGAHTVTIVKRTEAFIGFSQFLGFKFAGQIQPPPAKPNRRIEVVGDSITCGSGNEAANGSPQCLEDGFGQPYQNGSLAYGPVLARALAAEYHITSVSGIGLVRDYSDKYDARTLPQLYGLTFIEEMTSAAWDTSRFVPDVVVIGLGSNDFSPGDTVRPAMDQTTFSNGYIDFIGKLRGYYPNAHIFGISSPMLVDGWPAPTDRSASDLKDSLTKVVDHFTLLGDMKVHKFYVTKVTGEGCGVHPSVAQHAAMAREVGDYVKTVMGW
jgi:lysophospholipase L1-like esterase